MQSAAAALVAAVGLVGAVGFVSPVAPTPPALRAAAASRQGATPEGSPTSTAAASAAAAAAAAAATAAGSSLAAATVAAALAAAAVARRGGRGAPRKTGVARRAAAAADEALAEPEQEVFDPAKQVGATLPLKYFDPAGFCKVGDKETFYQYRCAELKHGRLAMIAALGAAGQHWLKLPGFEEVPSGLAAIWTPPGTYGLIAILAVAGGIEAAVWVQDPEKEPGNFGDPAGFGQYLPEWRDRELNNCRMGMISILGIVVAELVTGLDGVDQIWQPLGTIAVE